MIRPWCSVCHSEHESVHECPGELRPRGPERTAWRVTVETPRGLEAYGVRVADCGERWRARIVTFPNVLWVAPGLTVSMKFFGRTGQEAMQRAIEFVRRHSIERGHKMRGDRLVEPPPGTVGRGLSQPAPRKVRFIPLRFGVVRPSEPGGTGNLSESGLYIITPAPLAPGDSLTMAIHLEPRRTVELGGRVVWTTREPKLGIPPGMGIRLAAPPAGYVDYVRGLP